MSCTRGLPTIMHHQMRTLARVGSMQRCRKCYRPRMRPPNSLQLALYSDLARDTPTHFQHFTVAGDLPLLPTQVCVTNNTVTVDDEKRWTLPQGEQFALDLVSVIHIVVRVHHAGKWNSMTCEIGTCCVRVVVDDSNDLRACVKKLLVLGRQLTKVPSAKGSHKAPQKNQDNT